MNIVTMIEADGGKRTRQGKTFLALSSLQDGKSEMRLRVGSDSGRTSRSGLFMLSDRCDLDFE